MEENIQNQDKVNVNVSIIEFDKDLADINTLNVEDIKPEDLNGEEH